MKDEHGRSLTATSPGIMVGTPRYMAPEQVATDPVDGRCDVYSIGVMLYGLLTGEVPFAAATFREQLICTLRKVPEPVSARVALPAVMREAADSLVADCLQKDPSRRPDAEELLRRLEDLQARLQEGRGGPQRVASAIGSGGARGALHADVAPPG